MSTLNLMLDDELSEFVEQQCRTRGHASAAAYIESLLAGERLRARPERVAAELRRGEEDPANRILVDDAYWQRIEADIFAEPTGERET